MPRPPLVLSRALVTVLTAALMFGSVEGVARIRFGVPDRTVSRFEPDPLVSWRPRAGASFRLSGPEFSVTDTYNAHGLLNDAVAVPKPSGVFRILALGDSFTEGVQVARPERFVALLEESLRAPGQHVEVLNAGVSGYQTDQQVLAFERDHSVLSPDLILLFVFVGNDVLGNVSNQRAGEGLPIKPRFRLVDGNLVFVPVQLGPEGLPLVDPMGSRVSQAGRTGLAGAVESVKSALYEGSVAYQVLADAWYAARNPAGAQTPDDWRVFRTAPDEHVAEAWDVTAALLGRLASDARGSGAQLGVVIIPDALQIDDSRWTRFLDAYHLDPRSWDQRAPNRHFERICGEYRLTCLDLFEAMRAAGPRAYFASDAHFTALGHRAVAEAVRAWLERNVFNGR